MLPPNSFTNSYHNLYVVYSFKHFVAMWIIDVSLCLVAYHLAHLKIDLVYYVLIAIHPWRWYFRLNKGYSYIMYITIINILSSKVVGYGASLIVCAFLEN